MLKLIHNSDNINEFDKVFALYEQLQYSSDLQQTAEDIFDWLHIHFHIDNVTFSLFDIQSNHKENIFIQGEEFYLDDSKALFFIINTHTNQNAIVSFCATSKTHYEVLQNNYELIEAAFFLISPVIESKILKKNFIRSQSIDSVTNVYNRQFLTKHVNKLISLSGKQNNKIYFLMIGIDRLKAVVDEFDYDTGDKVLIELAKVIHSNISENDLVARLTGDEFLVAIVQYESQYHVETLARKIISDFAQRSILVNDNSQELKKTICIGADCFFPSTHNSIDLSIKNADIALYEARNNGRSEYKDFNDIKDEDTIELF